MVSCAPVDPWALVGNHSIGVRGSWWNTPMAKADYKRTWLCALVGLSNPPPAEGTDEAERNEEGGALAEAARLFDIEPEGHTHRVRHGCPRLQAHFAARGAERLRALAAEAAAATAQDQ